ncbi:MULTISPECIES: hypothetical protein [unclassified Beijerinckia]|nr:MULTISPECIES: hypothetical protein [unclassified Beijerinckia]
MLDLASTRVFEFRIGDVLNFNLAWTKIDETTIAEFTHGLSPQ